MSVKVATQHRLIARAMVLMLADPELDPFHRSSCEIPRRRADLGIARMQKRKRDRAARVEAARAETHGYGHGV